MLKALPRLSSHLFCVLVLQSHLLVAVAIEEVGPWVALALVEVIKEALYGDVSADPHDVRLITEECICSKHTEPAGRMANKAERSVWGSLRLASI